MAPEMIEFDAEGERSPSDMADAFDVEEEVVADEPEEAADGDGDDDSDVNATLAAVQAQAAEEQDDSEDDGGLDALMEDVFSDEAEDDGKMKAFQDLEHLTMLDVAGEVEAVIEELRIRQDGA